MSDQSTPTVSRVLPDGTLASRGWLVPPAWSLAFELVVNLGFAFGHRYLKRGSWTSREEYIAHVESSWPEYNRFYAHPFEWTWTNQKMRRWFAEHAP